MSNQNLTQASNQWAHRPADQRFWTVQDAFESSNLLAQQAVEKQVSCSELRVEARAGDVQLLGSRGTPAKLSWHAFGQMASRAGCPAGFLRKQPPTLAAQNLNWGLKEKLSDDPEASTILLFHKDRDDSLTLRAATSDKYERIWNWEVFDRLVNLESKGWRVPPARPSVNDPRARPATAEDVLQNSLRNLPGLAVREGDMIAPAGVYASDHDMFCFLVDETHLVEDGRGGALARGAFFWNSEVGDKSLGGMTFLYNAVCGNHIVWGASGVREFKIRHVGEAQQKWGKVQVELRAYQDGAASLDEARIKAAQLLELGTSKQEVLEAVLGLCRKAKVAIPERTIDAAYSVAEEHSDWYGSPRSAWRIVNGLTEVSQRTEHADVRVQIDRAAGKILATADF